MRKLSVKKTFTRKLNADGIFTDILKSFIFAGVKAFAFFKKVTFGDFYSSIYPMKRYSIRDLF